jgi:hypothetical protein
MPAMPSPPVAAACGVERWPVKTLADPDAIRVDLLNVTHTTVANLNSLAVHCESLPASRTFAEEFHVYEVSGIVLLTANETDHDVHVALADPADATRTIVVEVVDPNCAMASPYMTTLSNARLQYQNLSIRPGQHVTVRGVGFYDFAHGQTGRSQSCIELHPVLELSAGR